MSGADAAPLFERLRDGESEGRARAAAVERERSVQVLLEPGDDRRNIAWARTAYDALRPHMAHVSYANYQTEDADAGAAYGSNHQRLVALKNRLDPTNVFHLNQNVT